MDKPQGNVDAVTASGSVVTVTGWTIDPTQPNTSNPSQITDNGQPVTGSIATSALRADINKATGVTGRHGFTMTTKLTPGSHQICVLSHPLDTNRAAVTLAGCRTVQIASGR